MLLFESAEPHKDAKFDECLCKKKRIFVDG